MTQEKPNIFVSIIIAAIIYNITLKTFDYFKFFKIKETVASIYAKDIINSVNSTKFVQESPVVWRKLIYDGEECIKAKGKITAAIIRFYGTGTDSVYLSYNNSTTVNFATESAFLYRFTDGIIPRHLIKNFLTFQKGDFLYTSWKNIIKDDSSIADPAYKDITCSKILNEVRKPSLEEIEEYKIIEPELFSRPGP